MSCINKVLLLQIGTITADNASNILKAFDITPQKSNADLQDLTDEMLDTEIDRASSSDDSDTETDEDTDDNEDISSDFEEINYNKVTQTDVRSLQLMKTNSQVPHMLSDAKFYQQDNSPQRVPCTAHLMQLAVKDAIKNNNWVKGIESMIKKLTAYFNKSSKSSHKLRKLTNLKLIKIGETRWNSLYHAIKRLCRPVNHKQS